MLVAAPLMPVAGVEVISEVVSAPCALAVQAVPALAAVQLGAGLAHGLQNRAGGDRAALKGKRRRRSVVFPHWARHLRSVCRVRLPCFVT